MEWKGKNGIKDYQKQTRKVHTVRKSDKLLKIRPAENMEEEEIEQKVDQKFKEIIADGKAGWEVIAMTETRKIIKEMKNKKTGDKNNWKAEWIREGGDEMVQSLATLFKKSKRTEQNSNTRAGNKTKSLYKGGNKEKIQESHRGMFVMKIVCKVYETVKKIQNENKKKQMYQVCNCRKEKTG